MNEPGSVNEPRQPPARPDPRQAQFLTVITRDEATARFQRHLRLEPLGRETVPLGEARGRILADDVRSSVDVPAFDRSNVDGFAVQASDTFGAMEEAVRTLSINDEVLATGVAPRQEVAPGRATVLRRGQLLTSREIGVLAAIGLADVAVYRRPRVAILSTGDEIVAPGSPLRPGTVYDSNAAIIGAAVEELGGEAVQLGIVRDDDAALA